MNGMIRLRLRHWHFEQQERLVWQTLGKATVAPRR